jgi:GH25 family lysozyme M1 (1,4-beta-N-acetylmuramidase)
VVVARAQAWIERVRGKLGVEPIVYTGSDLWRNGGAAPLGSQALWLAHYTQGCPTLPSPWTRWTFWQHTDRGTVPGIDGPVDLDLFAGTLGELDTARTTAR